MRKFLTAMAGILLLAINGLQAQNKEVTGKVTDLTGTPIPGASIKIKGLKSGTSADANGAFKLMTPPKAVLVITGIGFESREITLGELTNVNIQLSVDTKALSEVVVTGVGVQTSKKKLAISVEAVTADKLPPSPSASIDQALIGKIPGAQISSIDGTPGANVNILLRGINSIQGGTYPMILVDGLEVRATNLNTLDLSSIERVEVIQGAAAATLYGAQGANGVIQLFTKRGHGGKVNIDVASSVSRNSYLNIGKLRKAKLHGFVTDGDNNVIDGNGDPLLYDTTIGGYTQNLQWLSTNPATLTNKPYDKNLKWYDQFKEFFVPANTFNNSITISGSKEKFDFLFAVSNNYQKANFKNNGDYNRTNLTSNLGIELAKNLRFRSLTQLAYTRNTINGDQGLIYPIFNSRPFINYDQKDPDGNYDVYSGDAIGVNGANPNYINQYTHTTDDKIDVIQDFNLNYRFTKFVTLDAKYGINYRDQVTKWTYDNQTNNASTNFWDTWYKNKNTGDASGEIDNFYYKDIFQNFTATATVKLDLQNDFHLKLPIVSTTQGGFDWRHDKQTENEPYAIGLPSYTPFTENQASTYGNGAAYTIPFVTYGYLLNERLDFGEFAGVAGGFRSDYSSAFGRGSKPFTFPNVNAYFRLSGFDFWKNSKIGDVISDFKLRGAYGEAGIQPAPFDRYVTLNTHNIGPDNAFYFSPRQPNPDLGVEVSKETEIGTDLNFNVLRGDWLKNIGLTVVYWKRETDNAIYDIAQAPSSGVSQIKQNAFGLASNGTQASINITMVSTKNLTWNFTTNFGHQTSKIKSVIGQPVVVLSAAGSTNYVLKADEKIGQLYGFLMLHSLTATDETGAAYIDKADQDNFEVASNGWVVNKATKAPYVTPSQHSFGDPNPVFNASFINEINYKGFLSLNFQFDWVHGAHLYNQTKEWMYRDGIHSDYEKDITINGETGAWAAFYRGVYAQVSRNGTKNYFYEDASFLRLRNVAVALDFAKAFRINGFRRLQLVLSGRNLWTHTKYTGMDPEVSSGTTNSAFDRGTDHNTMPNYKSYQVGLNIGL